MDLRGAEAVIADRVPAIGLREYPRPEDIPAFRYKPRPRLKRMLCGSALCRWSRPSRSSVILGIIWHRALDKQVAAVEMLDRLTGEIRVPEVFLHPVRCVPTRCLRTAQNASNLYSYTVFRS